MVRDIMRNPLFLAQKSEPATEADMQVVQDLLDTLKANKDRCVGMAANMIGGKKLSIAVDLGIACVAMINPVITKNKNPYETVEGCLSLDGVRKTIRYDEIEVEYQDIGFVKRKQTFKGYVAQIIQHEVDHCDGVVI